MGSAAGVRVFDTALFKKLVRLMDSDRQGEREAAFGQAMRLCAQCVPRKLFGEAVAEAFAPARSGSDADVASLRRKLEERESQAALLAEKYMEAQGRIEQLTAKLRERQHRPIHSFPELWEQAWACPQTRVLVVVVVLALRVACLWRANDAGVPALFWLLNISVGAVALPALWAWIKLEFERDGLLQLFAKAALLFGGLLLSCDLLIGWLPWQGWIEHTRFESANLMAPLHAVMVLGATGVLTVSKLSVWLIETAGSRIWESRPLQVLRGCF
jgi:hypothetical protein